MAPPAARVGLVLSGCGVHDGTEIHEAVLAMLALDRAGARIVATAPDVLQTHVVDHQRGDVAGQEKRNVRTESARIARGPVANLADLTPRDLDALVVPGGYGATKNLSDYAVRARGMQVNADLVRLVRAMHAARKPMAFLCTAPVVAARILGDLHPRLTIGRDAAVADDLASFGAVHEPSDVRGIVVDREHRIVSTPGYMLAQRISDAAHGIDLAMRALLEMR